jgi:hypothetical protein
LITDPELTYKRETALKDITKQDDEVHKVRFCVAAVVDSIQI